MRARRESAGLYAILVALIALVAVPYFFRALGSGWIWLGVGFAAALVASAFGIWRAAEWARWTAAILLFAATAALFLLGTAEVESRKSQDVLQTLRLFVVAGPGVWLLLPTTRDEFRRMREFSRRQRVDG